MINIEPAPAKLWQDEHRTDWRLAREVYKIEAMQPGDPRVDIPQRNQALGELFDVFGRRTRRVSILGSTWSQSDLFSTRAVIIDTDKDSAIWNLDASHVRPEHAGLASRFFLVSGGTKLETIMDTLDARDEPLSLMTAGSHKGQSIAGAVATGTHGSFFDKTGIEMHVRGLLFVAGTQHTHWIEDPENPILTDEFAAQLGQRGNDSAFNDVLIHLGGMGYLSAVLIEAVPRFTMSWAKAASPLPADWWEKIENGDFAGATDNLSPADPVFYELTFDPNGNADSDVMQSVYWLDDGQSAGPQEAKAPGSAQKFLSSAFDDDLTVEERLVLAEENDAAAIEESSHGGLINVPQMVLNAFRKSIEEDGATSTRPMSLVELTDDWTPRRLGPIRIETFNAAICVDRRRLKDAMDAGFHVAPHFSKHFVYTIRFAKGSQGSMAFLRFDECAIINIDGLMKKFPFSDSDDAARAFCDELEDRGIPYSMHWGKDIPSNAGKIAADFGSAAQRWRDARAALVPSRLRRNMDSPMLRHWGLS